MKACRGARTIATATEEASAAERLAVSETQAFRLGATGVSDAREVPQFGKLGIASSEQMPLVPRPLVTPRIGLVHTLDDGNSAYAGARAVSHEPVHLVDAAGNPIETETSVSERAQWLYRERAAKILDQALVDTPPANWKSPESLRESITKALKDEPAGSYSFDVTSGKLTLKTKVGRLEINGEMNVYRAAARAAKGVGIAGGTSYAAMQEHHLWTGASYWLGNGENLEVPKISVVPNKPAAAQPATPNPVPQNAPESQKPNGER